MPGQMFKLRPILFDLLNPVRCFLPPLSMRSSKSDVHLIMYARIFVIQFYKATKENVRGYDRYDNYYGGTLYSILVLIG